MESYNFEVRFLSSGIRLYLAIREGLRTFFFVLASVAAVCALTDLMGVTVTNLVDLLKIATLMTLVWVAIVIFKAEPWTDFASDRHRVMSNCYIDQYTLARIKLELMDLGDNRILVVLSANSNDGRSYVKFRPFYTSDFYQNSKDFDALSSYTKLLSDEEACAIGEDCVSFLRELDGRMLNGDGEHVEGASFCGSFSELASEAAAVSYWVYRHNFMRKILEAIEKIKAKKESN